MSTSINIENIFGFNPDKICYDISYERDKLCYASGNLIIIKRLFDNKSIFGKGTGNEIKTIKFFKRGKFIITTEINLKENKLVIAVYDIQNGINLYKNINVNINEFCGVKIKKIFFDLNERLDFIITLLNENNEMILFKGRLVKDLLDISCNYFTSINGLDISIKYIKFIFEYNWLICAGKEKIFSIRISLHKDNQEGNGFQIINQLSKRPFQFIPKSINIIRNTYKNNYQFNPYNDPIKISVLCSNGRCYIYSFELELLKEISLNTIENDINLNDEEENYDYIYNFTYMTYYEGIIILGSNDDLIYVYDSFSYNKKYVINITELNDNLIISPFSFVYVNEKNNLLYIILLNGQTFFGNLSSILYKKKGSLILLPYGHKNRINSLDICLFENEENNIAFYTISEDGPLIKTYYDGVKFNNKAFNQEKIKFTTCKINPKYNNLLFVGDEIGNLYIFNINNDDLSLLKKEKIANFKIDSINFNNTINIDYICIGFDSGTLIIYNIDIQKYKFDFLLKVCDDFRQNLIIKDKIHSFIYFYPEVDDNRICYLSNENSVSIGNLNSINNNLILMNEANYSYNIDKFGYILDIKVHPCQKYLFILLSSNQVDIRDLEDINIRIGVIDLFQYQKTNKINFDVSGDLMIFSNKDSLYMYHLRKNKIYKEISHIFDISFCDITKDGRYIILCGNNGIICILSNYDDIKCIIYNYKDAEIKYGIKKIKKMFYLDLNDVLLKERKISKIKNDNVKSENGQYQLEVQRQNNEKYRTSLESFNPENQNKTFKQKEHFPSYSNNINYISNNTLQKINIIKDFNKTKFNSSFDKRNKMYIPEKQLNQTFNQKNNLNYKKDVFQNYGRKTNTLRNNVITLNKDPSIFPINQNPIIQKIDKDYYMNSKSMIAPPITSNLIEKISKKNQDNIRFQNISNAVNDILGPNYEREKKIKNENSNFQNENLKNHIQVNQPQINYEKYQTMNINKSFNSNYSRNDEGNNSNLINKNNNNNSQSYRETYSNDSSFYSRITNNANYYINHGIENRKKNILPDDDSIDNLNEELEYEYNNNEESLTSNSNSRKKINDNMSLDNISKDVSNNYSISKHNYSKHDYSVINSYSKNSNNSIVDDIDNVERDIEIFEKTYRNFIK